MKLIRAHDIWASVNAGGPSGEMGRKALHKTWKWYVREARRLTDYKWQDNDMLFRSALMLAIIQVGPTVKALQEFSGLPSSFCSDLLRRLRVGHILKNGKLSVGWFEKDGGVAFCLDCAVVEGWLLRKVTP